MTATTVNASISWEKLISQVVFAPETFKVSSYNFLFKCLYVAARPWFSFISIAVWISEAGYHASTDSLCDGKCSGLSMCHSGEENVVEWPFNEALHFKSQGRVQEFSCLSHQHY